MRHGVAPGVNEPEDLLVGLIRGLSQRPAGEILGQRVQISDATGEIGDDDAFRIRGGGDDGRLSVLLPLAQGFSG